MERGSTDHNRGEYITSTTRGGFRPALASGTLCVDILADYNCIIYDQSEDDDQNR